MQPIVERYDLSVSVRSAALDGGLHHMSYGTAESFEQALRMVLDPPARVRRELRRNHLLTAIGAGCARRVQCVALTTGVRPVRIELLREGCPNVAPQSWPDDVWTDLWNLDADMADWLNAHSGNWWSDCRSGIWALPLAALLGVSHRRIAAAAVACLQHRMDYVPRGLTQAQDCLSALAAWADGLETSERLDASRQRLIAGRHLFAGEPARRMIEHIIDLPRVLNPRLPFGLAAHLHQMCVSLSVMGGQRGPGRAAELQAIERDMGGRIRGQIRVEEVLLGLRALQT